MMWCKLGSRWLLTLAIPLLATCGPGEVTPTADRGLPSSVTAVRVDFWHTGSALSESFELDELIEEGPWAGAPGGNIDPFGYGPYFFEVQDARSEEPLHSRGFASIFGEWQTTGEARDTTLAFHESVRFPKPDAPVLLIISKRDTALTLKEVWRVRIDPAGSRPRVVDQDLQAWNLIDSGPPSEKVDILLLGDGYTVGEMDKWHADARRMTDTLFSYEPLRSRRHDFNVRAVDTPADQSGIAKPSEGINHETPLGATYDAFGMERYVLTFANKRWRDAAGMIPYEFVVVVANDRKYGGAGIYNLFSTVAADNEFAAYVLVHEFGHHFAGLGDEYYTSNVTYETDEARPEPWSPNVTANALEPKWKDLVSDSTPLPTPWPKSEYEALQRDMQARRHTLRSDNAPEEEIEALFKEERERSTALLRHADHAHEIGAFEGANYASTGYYRPEIDCIMFTRRSAGFCRVCTRAINRMIDLYAGNSDTAASTSP